LYKEKVVAAGGGHFGGRINGISSYFGSLTKKLYLEEASKQKEISTDRLIHLDN